MRRRRRRRTAPPTRMRANRLNHHRRLPRLHRCLRPHRHPRSGSRSRRAISMRRRRLPRSTLPPAIIRRTSPSSLSAVAPVVGGCVSHGVLPFTCSIWSGIGRRVSEPRRCRVARRLRRPAAPGFPRSPDPAPRAAGSVLAALRSISACSNVRLSPTPRLPRTQRAPLRRRPGRAHTRSQPRTPPRRYPEASRRPRSWPAAPFHRPKGRGARAGGVYAFDPDDTPGPVAASTVKATRSLLGGGSAAARCSVAGDAVFGLRASAGDLPGLNDIGSSTGGMSLTPGLR